jgi:hypothetical protein
VIRFLLVAMSLAPQAIAQTAGTAFTYQGRLADSGAPANGPYDFQMVLYTAAVGGSQVGPVVVLDDVAVAGGLFTVNLDFGPGAFPGDARYLEIGVRPGASGGAYTLLGTRQELKPAPHSVFSQEAPWTGVGGKPPGFADDVDNDVLGGLACANGQVAKWNGATWACAADTDTTYTAGAGLNLAGTTFSVADLGVTTAKLANDAVTSAKVADASIATADLADNAVTSAKIADGTIALADLGPNGCAPNQIMKWSGAAWVCAPDIDTNSGGTVTSVGTGAGLTGGPITVAGTVAVATGGITSSLIANGAVGLAQINTAQVQARVSGTCPVGQYLRGINTNGTVLCEPMAGASVITTVDNAGLVGSYSSIAIGVDGLPVISYYDGTLGDLKVAHCGNSACSAANTVTMVDNSASIVGLYTSIAIGFDGFPVISYRDQPGHALKVAHCGNAACTAGNTLTTVDAPGNDVGLYTSIAIGNDGFPIVSYYDQTATALKVAHCGNASCTAGNTVTVVDDTGNVGQYTSIAITPGGFPVIAYYEQTPPLSLKVARCGNAACTTGNVITTVDDPANQVGEYTSIAIGGDGFPVISYTDVTAGALKVLDCANLNCTAGNTITTVDDPADSVGQYTSIAVGTDGLPIVSHFDATAGALRVAHCGIADCSSGTTAVIVDDPANAVGSYTSIGIGVDGLPVISYAGSGLKVLKCGTRTCQ